MNVQHCLRLRLNRFRFIALPLLATCLFIACAHSTPETEPQFPGNLVFRDMAGQVVAVAEISWPDVPPMPGATFAGGWRILESKTPFTARPEDAGRYQGNAREDGAIGIDLTPMMRDNNTLLDGRVNGGIYSGAWSQSSFAGSREMGRFELRIPNDRTQNE